MKNNRQIKNDLALILNLVNVPALWHESLGINPESVKLTQVAIDSQPMQLCTLAQVAAMGSIISLHLTGIQTRIIKIWFDSMFLIK